MKHLKIIIILINLLGLGIQYGLSVARADVGPQLTRMSTQIQQLEKENQLLAGSVSEQGSLSQLQVMAESMGLKPVKTQSLEPVRVALSQP